MPQPTLHAFLGIGIGERLIEDRRSTPEVFPMGKLVENQLGEIDISRVDEGIQHRVMKPPERRVSIHSTDLDIIALGTEFLRQLLRIRFIEEAPVVELA